MNVKRTMEALQLLTTALANGAFTHFVQGKHISAMGFKTLGKKYIDHYEEEMGWAEKFIDRLNDLGGQVKIEDQKGCELITDPIAYLKADLDRQEKGLPVLYKFMEELKDDPTTYDILKAYLADEEEDLYWSQEQVQLIEMIGAQNWLVKQL